MSTISSWDKYGFYGNSTKANILTPTSVENLEGSLVEIAISNGELYVAINGVGKARFTLSELNANFTAKTKYSVGFCTYNGAHASYPNGGARWEDITAKFGAKANADVEAVALLCLVEEYAIGTELYSNASMTKSQGTLTYVAETIGVQTFDGVELEQGTEFVVYATVQKGMTAENIGFVVGTFENNNKNHLLFQWRKSQGDIYIWRDYGSWTGHQDYLITSDIGTDGAEIALVYRKGYYFMFLNGTQVCAIGKTLYNGWGGTVNVTNEIGTTGTIKIGLSIAYRKQGSLIAFESGEALAFYASHPLHLDAANNHIRPYYSERRCFDFEE